ncbi:MAG TPA: proton-conducting transporter membrane subunit, partial [Gemmatimonadaceae bacterium]|nr:proton-conducting transporter membrane subunit [Gemmatimonadaceae bacterium]
VAAYFLVVVESEKAEVRRAGLIYLVATHTGTLALFGLFAWWGKSAADLTFASLAAAAPRLPSGGAAVLVLALFGFGLKAGLVPLHFWLPEAHAAAPSHVSAIMSGVVIKMGVYGLLRVIALMGVVPAWWAWIVLALGIASGVLGVVWALAQHDIKRLLAFHSVENIGIILMGMGLGALGLVYDHPAVALLGFAGAALHTLNHALFKSLLFLGAGSVIRATGTRDIERLGGLARHMPRTMTTFLIASIAIVGLPPLNGFVSEWIVYRAMLRVGLVADASRLAMLSALALALIGGLALACFAKVVGIIYLGMPRDASFGAARESPAGMTRPLIALAAACAGIGLLPVLVLRPMLRVAAVVASGVGESPERALSSSAALFDPAGAAMTWLSLGLTAFAVVVWVARAAFHRKPESRGGTWGCGYAGATARMQYSASSFAAPLLTVLAPVAGVRTHRSAATFATRPTDPMLDRAVRPVWHRLQHLADALRPIQRGRLSSYLLYIVAAVMALLLY